MSDGMQTGANPILAIGSAQTKITRFFAFQGPESLEKLADYIETAAVPLTVLELSQLCAMLCRRLAALEKHPNSDSHYPGSDGPR